MAAAVWACGFDDALREYLYTQFWQPFAKSGRDFGTGAPAQSVVAYAGMTRAESTKPLDKLRAAYQELANGSHDEAKLDEALKGAHRAWQSLSMREREEVDLIDAKIDMRAGSLKAPDRLLHARDKFRKFLRTARTPAFRSEARGWIAHIHYLADEQSQAGKIYLDELQRRDSNLSRDTLLDSLRLTYGYDGGEKLTQELELYFDTPDHAAFAISLITNPKWKRDEDRRFSSAEDQPAAVEAPPPYERINALLLKHGELFRSQRGADILAELGMRTALRAGDPSAALKIEAEVAESATVRRSPDFLWMLGAARFLSRDYEGAEKPLLQLLESKQARDAQRAAAAYGLCGVYFKTGNRVEQIRVALLLQSMRQDRAWIGAPFLLSDLSVYWAFSGFDLAMILDIEAPIEAIQHFLDKYPKAKSVDLVQYALAVRLARIDQYTDSAELYAKIGARTRAGRMRQLAALQQAAQDSAGSAESRSAAKYKVSELLAAHSAGVYFNDKLWSGFQRYAMYADKESHLTRLERERMIAAERQLKDQQEEYWRAYLLLREVMRESGRSALGRRAAELSLRCLRRINTERFGREKEILAADVELTRWLRGA